MNRPVFVFGISGATWRVIDPLIAAGRLPHLQRLRDEGCSATLNSVRVPGDRHYRPAVAWASLATGCVPVRHGITRYFHSADDLKVPSLWDIFASNGRRVGIYGWPLDWPPREVDGFMVPSHLARDSRTWPPELTSIKALDREQQNAERQGAKRSSPTRYWRAARSLARQGVRARTLALLGSTVARGKLSRDAEQRSLLLRGAKIELSVDFFLHLYRRYQPDFCSFHTFLVDFVSHRFWRYTEPALFPETPANAVARFGNAVTDAYMKTDRALGRLLAALPRDATIAVMSEHGMRAEPESSEVGAWRYVIDPQRLSVLIGLDQLIVGAPVARWIAYRSRLGGPLPPYTVERLLRVEVRETGLPLFQVHRHGVDEIVVKLNIEAGVPRYREGNLEQLTLKYDDRQLPFSAVTRRLGRARSAMHDGEGILLLHGPNIRRGERLRDTELINVAPTLLKASGILRHPLMDGNALDVWAAEHEGAGDPD